VPGCKNKLLNEVNHLDSSHAGAFKICEKKQGHPYSS
jgi:hypothetical protein